MTHEPVSDAEFARRLIDAKKHDLAKLDVAIIEHYPDADGAQVATFAEFVWELLATVAGLDYVPGPILRRRLAEWADKRQRTMSEAEVFAPFTKAGA